MNLLDKFKTLKSSSTSDRDLFNLKKNEINKANVPAYAK